MLEDLRGALQIPFSISRAPSLLQNWMTSSILLKTGSTRPKHGSIHVGMPLSLEFAFYHLNSPQDQKTNELDQWKWDQGSRLAKRGKDLDSYDQDMRNAKDDT